MMELLKRTITSIFFITLISLFIACDSSFGDDFIAIVKGNKEGITLNKTSTTILAGGMEQLTATVNIGGSTGQSIALVWTSSDDTVATVSSSGLVTAITSGTTVITVSTTDGSYTANCTVTVTYVPVAVTGVTLDITGDSITTGSTLQLTATVSPSNATNQNVTWASSDLPIATVSSSGLVTAIATGTATITVTTVDGNYTANCTVTVTDIAVTGITLNTANTSLYTTNTYQLTATITPSNATDQNVTWSSSDSAIATVDTTGFVTGVAAGTAAITATSADGPSATCNVTVVPRIIQVASGWNCTLIVKDDGTLWSAGSDHWGNSRNYFAQVMTNVKSVAVSPLQGTHTMILEKDGTLWAVGGNYYGQLGNGATTDITVPEQVMTGVAYVACGYQHTMVVKTDGTLWAAGYNGFGQLGLGSITPASTFTQVTTTGLTVDIGSNVAAVYCGSSHTVIIGTGGAIWAAGNNTSGQLGDGTTVDKTTPVYLTTAPAINASGLSVSCGAMTTIIVGSDGNLYGTGSGTNGEFGMSSTAYNTLTQLTSTGDIKSVSSGEQYTMILKTDGTVWGSGYNNYGWFGNNSTTQQYAFSQMVTTLTGTDIGALSCGYYHSMVLSNDGTELWGAGYNGSGQLGDSTNTDSYVPVLSTTE